MNPRILVLLIVAGTVLCLFLTFANGSRVFTSHTLILSRDSGQAVSEARWFGKLADRTVYDIKNIQYAQLEFGRAGTKRIVFIMRDDSVVIPLRSAFTDEEGYYAVVNAVNRVLGVQRNLAPLSQSTNDP